MRAEEYRAMFDLEDRLWWYDGMRAVTASLLDRHVRARGDLRILDAGCGTGFSLRWLAERFSTELAFGVDASPHAARLWKKRGVDSAALASIERLPFGSGEFDLVTCFDVIYQLAPEQAARAVSELHRVLKPGGILFIREPAYDWMRSRHDEAVGTRHRFTLAELRGLLGSHSLVSRRATYANTLLFGAAVAHRTLSRLKGGSGSDVKPVAAWANALMRGALKLEARLLGKITFPFGLSVIALAEKREGEWD